MRTARGHLGVFGFIWLVTMIAILPTSWSELATSSILAAVIVLVYALATVVYYRFRFRKDGTKPR